MAELDPMTATTLTEMIERRAHLSPLRPYFHLFGETVTYQRLWMQSGRFAAGLARAGVGAGDKVALIYPTCAEFFYTFIGALRVGAVPVPLYPTLGVEATGRILANSESVAVATIGWFRQGVDASVALAPGVRAVLEPPDLDVDAPAPPPHFPHPDDLAFLQYTSGSTGRPRGVMLNHRNVISTIHFMAEAAGLTADDRVVSWLPLYHDMGLIGCAFTPPLLGTPLWLLPPDLRNPRQWLELITEVKATFTVSPDFGYRNCVRNIRDTSDLDLTTLKGALSGAEPVRLSTIEAFEAHFGVKNVILPCYGLAEATLAVAIWPRATPLRVDVSGRFLSVGKPCRGVSVRIMTPLGDDDGGAPSTVLPTDTEGEICVESPGVMQGYYGDPEATARVVMPDGWLRTGDLGFLDGEGYLYITGRLKDVMNLGGENVAPADIEEIVDHIAGVRYSAAVGLDSDRTGTQRLHVVAEVREETASPETFRDLVREIVTRVHRGRRHRPARVLLVRAGTIPKTSSGKIQRSRLAAMIVEGELQEHLVYSGGR
ncbi:MAG TPA: AMP-binding protein [Methylomirabilota bacterium]|jgi:fatty-acyl-CoA synthase